MTRTKSKFRSKFQFRLYSGPATGRNFSGIFNLVVRGAAVAENKIADTVNPFILPNSINTQPLIGSKYVRLTNLPQESAISYSTQL
jgi:hypothetical protein